MVQKKPVGERSFLVAILLSALVGGLGIDRFYMGYILLGVLKLITFGGCGIWWIIDLILIATDNLQDADGKYLKKD
ncbi:MAG: TM2 domain-containing protein [Nanoarchaeota archaeon]|nr:TM2 domain-containing protein [Nanoarchaeota archaeon]